MTVNAGQKLTASQYATDILGGTCVKRGRRETNSTTTTTEQSVLRIDTVQLLSGRLYLLKTNSLQPFSSVANDYVGIRLRYSTSGTADTSSTVAIVVQDRYTGASGNETTQAEVTYAAGSNQTMSLLLTVGRVSGTGNVGLTGSSTVPIELMVIDLGVDPGDTGTDL
jgi:hypothetical protein